MNMSNGTTGPLLGGAHMQYPMAPDAPPAPSHKGTSTRYTDNSIVVAIAMNGTIGAVCLLLFLFFQARSQRIYRFRTVTEAVTIRPPKLPTKGHAAYWAWLYYAWMIPDSDLLMSCGLDALVLSRLPMIALMLFVPMAFLGMTVLVPIYWTLSCDTLDCNTTTYDSLSNSMVYRMTTAGMPEHNSLYWVQIVLVYLYTAYGLWILYWHYEHFAELRRLYLERGDNITWWSELMDGSRHGFVEQRSILHGMFHKVMRHNHHLAQLQVKLLSGDGGEDEGDDVLRAHARSFSRADFEDDAGADLAAAAEGVAQDSDIGGAAPVPAPALGSAQPLYAGHRSDSVPPAPAPALRHAAQPRPVGEATEPDAVPHAPPAMAAPPAAAPAALPLARSASAPLNEALAAASCASHVDRSTTGRKGAMDASASSAVASCPIQQLELSALRTKLLNPLQQAVNPLQTMDYWHANNAATVVRMMERTMDASGVSRARGSGHTGAEPSGIGAAAAAAAPPPPLPPQVFAQGMPTMFLRRPSCRNFRTMWVDRPDEELQRDRLLLSAGLHKLYDEQGGRSTGAGRAEPTAVSRPLLARRRQRSQPDASKDPYPVAQSQNMVPVQAHHYAVLVTDVTQHPFGPEATAAAESEAGAEGAAANGGADAEPEASPLVVCVDAEAGGGRRGVSEASLGGVQSRSGGSGASAGLVVRNHASAAALGPGVRSNASAAALGPGVRSNASAAVLGPGFRSNASAVALGPGTWHNPSVVGRRAPSHALVSQVSKLVGFSRTLPVELGPGIYPSKQFLEEGDGADAARPLQTRPSLLNRSRSRQLSANIDLKQRPSSAALSVIHQQPSIPEDPAAPSAGELEASASASVGAPPMPDMPDRRPAALWAIVRAAVWSGEVQRLPSLPSYDVVSATFCRLFPADFDRAIPVWNCGAVEHLLQQWNSTLNSLDYALAVWEAKGIRPTQRKRLMGLTGPEVDLIEDYTIRLVDLQRRILEERKHAATGRGGTFTGAYIVLFKTQTAAALASSYKTIFAQHRGQFSITQAPSPEDVNWPTIAVPYGKRRLRRLIWLLPLILLVLFPIGLFSSILSQLDWILCVSGNGSIVGYFRQKSHGNDLSGHSDYADVEPLWPAFCENGSFGIWLFRVIVTNWIPGLLDALWAALVLPRFFHFFAMAQGTALTLSAIDRQVLAYYWWYNVMNIFLSGLLGGWLAVGFHDVFSKSINTIYAGIGYALSAAANYFLIILTFKALVEPFYKLLVPNGNARFYWWRKYTRRHQGIIPEREMELSLVQSRSFRNATEVGRFLLIFVLGAAMCIAAPLVTAAACVCLFFTYVSLRYRLLYLYIRKLESGGCAFPMIFERLLGCLGIMAFMSGCALASEEDWAAAWAVFLPPLVVIIWTGWYCRRRFKYAFDHMPLELTIGAPQARVDSKMYLPVPLHPSALGWHPYWIKCWQGWGPTYEPSWSAKGVTQPAPRQEPSKSAPDAPEQKKSV